MNTKFQKMVIATIIFAGLLSSCKKSESVGYAENAEIAVDSASVVSDSISTVSYTHLDVYKRQPTYPS